MPNFVQIFNPKIDRYVLINRESGEIVEHRDEPGPYPDVPIAKMRTIKNPPQPSDNITIEQAREAVRAVAEKREQPEPRVGFLRRRGEGEGKYKSSISGRYVSAYYAKRHPKTTYKVGPGERARDLKNELKAEGRVFSDSADLIHWDRVGVTPEEAAEWVMGHRDDPDAEEFAERFLKRCEELRAEG